VDDLKVNQHFWAEVTPLQHHIREQCAVHSHYGTRSIHYDKVYTTEWVAKLIIGDVTVYLDEVNALRVAQALTSAAIQSNKLDGQY